MPDRSDARRPGGAPSVLVFDVNETLIDIASLEPYFERVFGAAAALRTWFDELVLYSMTLTLSGQYVDFLTLGQAVLRMLGEARGMVPTDDEQRELGESMRTMPAHPDAAPGLEKLLEDGYRLVTLTNSPHRPNARTPLDNAGLSQYFELQHTVDDTGVYKPSAQLYHRVAASTSTPPEECMMVAAHAWDTIGAQSAGMRGALITRPGNAALVVAGVPRPTLIAANVLELATQMEAFAWATAAR